MDSTRPRPSSQRSPATADGPVCYLCAMARLWPTTNYLDQRQTWPSEGRHILASHDDSSIVVYRAYRPSIASWAVEHQRFGGEWSLTRMSWIKPSFLWMMYRCGWAQKRDQERVLAVRLSREGFNTILREAVHSSFVPEHYESTAAWKQAMASSSVRLQWDPDHDPHGNKLARRAIQLGLRGATLRAYAQSWCLGITDITGFVREQHKQLRGDRLHHLEVPRERLYAVEDDRVARRLGLADAGSISR